MMMAQVTVALAAAFALGLASPVGAQEVSRPLLRRWSPGTIDAQTAGASQQSGGGTKDPNWDFRWEEHPSLRVGEWLRVDFRARFQGHLRRSDVLIDPGAPISTHYLNRSSHEASLVPLVFMAAGVLVAGRGTWGVLRLTLRSGQYDWALVPVAGERFSDSGRSSGQSGVTNVAS